MIQDIAPHRLKNQYQPGKRAGAEDYVVCARDGALLVPKEGALRFPSYGELVTGVAGVAPEADVEAASFDVAALLTPDAMPYLFSVDDSDYYLVRGAVAAPAGWQYVKLRQLRAQGNGPRAAFFAAYTAMHLATWYADNRYCGRCGHETVHSETERALVCPQCGRVIYPRLIPAIIAGVIDGDRILLTKYAHRKMPFYALIAGFMEIGETLEECVAREVYEEVGLHVKNLRYYKSQPWGNVQDILAGFYCDVDGSTDIRLARDELREAIWVPRKEVVGQTDDFSLTHDMMMTFRAGLEPR